MNINAEIASLPRTLTHLALPFMRTYGYSFDASFLPPNLTTLKTYAEIEEDSYHKIPKSLTKLMLYNPIYEVENLSPHLPAGLRSLFLHVDSDAVIGESLAHLTNLERFKTHYSTTEETFMTKYPPNLKSCISCFDTVGPVKITPFPFGITTIDLLIHKGIDQSFFAALPQTVTELQIDCHGLRPPFDFLSLLPKQLRTLKVPFCIQENLSLLPKSITNLRLRPFGLFVMVHDALPPNLETLDLWGYILKPSLLKSLPSSLTDLNLASSDMVVDDEVIRCLPRGLTSLNLHIPTKINHPMDIKYPPNLKTLIWNEKCLTDECIPLLPRSLTRLSLEYNFNLTDKCIKYLPPKLTTLRLPKCNQITSKFCEDVPSHSLCSLQLANYESWPKEAQDSLKESQKYLDVEYKQD